MNESNLISEVHAKCAYNHEQALKAISCLKEVAGVHYILLVQFKESPVVFVDSHCYEVQRSKFEEAICNHWKKAELKRKKK
jgi:hypothetical protein